MKRIITALLIDDDPSARNILQNYLENEDKVHIIASLDNTSQAVETILKHKPDVVFLDINMPCENGLQFAARLKDSGVETLLVFTTAFMSYALDAYAFRPFDFLEKPFGSIEISILLSKIESQLNRSDASLNSKNIRENSGKFRFRTNHGYLFLLPLEIVYVRSVRNYCELILSSGDVEKVLLPISVIHKEFVGSNFRMINRSVIINLSYIVRIDRKLKTCVISYNETEFELPITQKNLVFFENLNTVRLG